MLPNTPDPAEISRFVAELVAVCKKASHKGLINGWSGNASVRYSGETIFITASGTAKGDLTAEDIVCASPELKTRPDKPAPSSECKLHFALYYALKDCQAILHTHPPYMQALEQALEKRLANTGENLSALFLRVNIYEADNWRRRLFHAGKDQPGSAELAKSAMDALNFHNPTSPPGLPCALWLPLHGLCAMGRRLDDCLYLSEELEHLAKVQLLHMLASQK